MRSSGPSRRSTRPGSHAVPLPVSHAFHTQIVAPASEPLRATLERLDLRAAEHADRRQRERRVLPDGRRRRAADARHPRAPGGLAGAVRRRAAARCTRPARASSSRSGRRRRCRASSRTCSATSADVLVAVHQPSASWATSRRSTRRCAGCTRPGSGRPRRAAAAPARGARAGRRRSAAAGGAVQRRSAAARSRQCGRRSARRPRTSSSATCSPTSSTRAGASVDGDGVASAGAGEPVVITGAALGLPGTDRGLRRRERRAGCSRRAAHRRHPEPAAPRDARQAHHAAREARGRRADVRDDRRPVATSSSSPARAGAFDLDGGVRRRRGAHPRARRRHRARHRGRHRRAARRRASRWSCTTRPRPRARQLPERWGLPDDAPRRHRRRSSRRRFPGSTRSPTSCTRYHLDRARRRASWPTSSSLRARLVGPTGDGTAFASSTGGSPSCEHEIDARRRTPSTAASCSASCRWGTRSSPSSSARAGRTPR